MIILFRNNVIDGGKNDKKKIWDVFFHSCSPYSLLINYHHLYEDSTGVWANQEDSFPILLQNTNVVIHSTKTFLRPRQDSNLQSPDSKSGALSIGPRGQS